MALSAVAPAGWSAICTLDSSSLKRRTMSSRNRSWLRASAPSPALSPPSPRGSANEPMSTCKHRNRPSAEQLMGADLDSADVVHVRLGMSAEMLHPAARWRRSDVRVRAQVARASDRPHG